jgi:hypothetical protein
MPLTRDPMRRAYRNTGPSSDVVDAVLARSQYSCEIAGCEIGDRRGVDFSLHHRRPRQMGGTNWPGSNLPSNILVCCGSGTTGCHGVVESHRSGAVAAGWLVLSRADPADVAVLICRERYVYLTYEATYATDPPERAA